MNCNRALLAAVELRKQLTNKKDYIALLTEPYTKFNKLVLAPNKSLKVISGGKKNERPRAAIIAHRSLKMIALQDYCTRDMASIFGVINGNKTVITSIYMDINKPVVSEKMQTLLDWVEERGYKLIIGADTNAHSELFGDSTNVRGEELEGMIATNMLRVENIGRIPTFQPNRQGIDINTYIDVTLTGGLRSGEIKGWRVSQAYNGSDHNTIRFGMKTGEQKSNATRNWAKGKWEEFTKTLTQREIQRPTQITRSALNKQVEKFYKIINGALDLYCPKKKQNEKTNKNRWYSQRLEELSKKVRRSYDKMRENRNINNISKYANNVKKYKKLCKKSKNKSWRNYKKKIKTVKDMAFVAELMQREERNFLSTFKKADGSTPNQEKKRWICSLKPISLVLEGNRRQILTLGACYHWR